MLTGMRAMDMEGRISYVNPGVLRHDGFSETDLIGQHPPFPTGRTTGATRTARLLEQELQGESPTGGIQVKVREGRLGVRRAHVRLAADRPEGAARPAG